MRNWIRLRWKKETRDGYCCCWAAARWRRALNPTSCCRTNRSGPGGTAGRRAARGATARWCGRGRTTGGLDRAAAARRSAAGRGRWDSSRGTGAGRPPDDPDEPGAPDPLVVDPDEVLGLPLPEGADEPGGALAAEDDGELPEEPLLPEEPDEPEVPDDDEPGGALAAEDDGALPEDPLLPDEPEVPECPTTNRRTTIRCRNHCWSDQTKTPIRCYPTRTAARVNRKATGCRTRCRRIPKCPTTRNHWRRKRTVHWMRRCSRDRMNSGASYCRRRRKRRTNSGDGTSCSHRWKTNQTNCSRRWKTNRTNQTIRMKTSSQHPRPSTKTSHRQLSA